MDLSLSFSYFISGILGLSLCKHVSLVSQTASFSWIERNAAHITKCWAEKFLKAVFVIHFNIDI